MGCRLGCVCGGLLPVTVPGGLCLWGKRQSLPPTVLVQPDRGTLVPGLLLHNTPSMVRPCPSTCLHPRAPLTCAQHPPPRVYVPLYPTETQSPALGHSLTTLVPSGWSPTVLTTTHTRLGLPPPPAPSAPTAWLCCLIGLSVTSRWGGGQLLLFPRGWQPWCWKQGSRDGTPASCGVLNPG